MNTPGFTAEVSLINYGGEFRIVAPKETALDDRTIIMADYGCPQGYKCLETTCLQMGCANCQELPSVLCSRNMGRRWYDPWYTRCADFKKYSDGSTLQQGGDYWGDNGCHYSNCDS